MSTIGFTTKVLEIKGDGLNSKTAIQPIPQYFCIL